MLEESSRRLQTDRLDLWQIHEVVYENDPDLIFLPNGVAEALHTAKQQGKVRFVGFTGTRIQRFISKCSLTIFLLTRYRIPLNCFGTTFRSFETRNSPRDSGFGDEELGGSGEMVRHGAITAEQGLRDAMSLPVATTISGNESIEVLHQNLAVAVNFQPLTSAEMQGLREQCRKFAVDGRDELFKTTTKYDGKVGREQHHFPAAQELPL
jgi:hypothetical protein